MFYLCKLSASLLRETGDGGCFRIEYLEHGHELRDLQDFLEFCSQVAENERCALELRAYVCGDQDA